MKLPSMRYLLISCGLWCASCATTPSAPTAPAEKPLKDPVQDALSGADEGEFYVSRDSDTLVQTASNQILSGRSWERKRADILAKKIAQIMTNPEFVEEHRQEALLIFSRLSGIGYDETVKLATQTLQQRLSKSPKGELDEYEVLELAYAALEERRNNLATYYFDRVSSSSDPRVQAASLNGRALILSRNDHTAEAVQLLEKAVALVPSYTPAQLNLGILYIQMGDPTAAQLVLGRLPADSLSLYLLLVAYRMGDKAQVAANLCQKVMARKPLYPPVELSCGLNAFQGQRDLKNAERYVANAIARGRPIPPLEAKLYRLNDQIAGEKKVAKVPSAPAKKTAPKTTKKVIKKKATK